MSKLLDYILGGLFMAIMGGGLAIVWLGAKGWW